MKTFAVALAFATACGAAQAAGVAPGSPSNANTAGVIQCNGAPVPDKSARIDCNGAPASAATTPGIGSGKSSQGFFCNMSPKGQASDPKASITCNGAPVPDKSARIDCNGAPATTSGTPGIGSRKTRRGFYCSMHPATKTPQTVTPGIGSQKNAVVRPNC